MYLFNPITFEGVSLWLRPCLLTVHTLRHLYGYATETVEWHGQEVNNPTFQWLIGDLTDRRSNSHVHELLAAAERTIEIFTT